MGLDSVLASVWILYFQWAYSIWQLVRNNSLFMFVVCAPLSLLLDWWFARRKVFVALPEHPFVRAAEEGQEFDRGADYLNDPIEAHKIRVLRADNGWLLVDTKWGQYLVWYSSYVRLKIALSSGNTWVVLSDEVYPGYFLGYTMPKRKLIEAFLIEGMASFQAPGVSFGFYNPTFSTQLLTFLSTIPLLLQARNLVIPSTLASVLLIGVDLFRTPLYSAYDGTFNHVVKLLKVHLFKRRTWCYQLLSVFSTRWKYCDHTKKYGYYSKEFPLCTNNCFLGSNLNNYEVYTYSNWSPTFEDVDFSIYGDRAHAKPMKAGAFAVASISLKRAVFVSDHMLAPHLLTMSGGLKIEA